MSVLTDAERKRLADAEAAAEKLGYRLMVDEAPNMPAPITHMAFAGTDNNQPSMGRFLTYSTSVPDAAEAGLGILRGIVNNGDAWPVQ